MEQITLNDYDRSVYAFWYSVLNHTEALCARIEEVDLTMAVWRETSIELNLAMIKIKHTIKKGRKAID